MVVPNFLIIGAPKAGTSSIYHYLKQHPEVYMSPVKEPHFFSFENEEINFQGPGDRERLQGTVTRWEDYLKLFASVGNEIAIGEASTTYLGNSKAPQRIKHYLPQVKLIAILRNPVDAAYASFLHLVRDGDETLPDFALALQQEPARISKNWEDIWHYKNRGFYYSQIKRYFDLFEREQIQVYRYEDWQNNPQNILTQIYQFIGVKTDFKPDMSVRHNVSGMPKNATLNRLLLKPNPLKSTFNFFTPKPLRNSMATYLKKWNFNGYQKPKLSIEIKQKLTQEYREEITKLQDLIEQDLSIWLKT